MNDVRICLAPHVMLKETRTSFSVTLRREWRYSRRSMVSNISQKMDNVRNNVGIFVSVILGKKLIKKTIMV